MLPVKSLDSLESSAYDLTSGTVLNDGRDFTGEVECVMSLEIFRREGGETGDSLSEGMAVGMIIGLLWEK